MIEALKRFLSKYRAEGHEKITTPADVSIAFDLMYEHLRVGTLTLEKGTWEFAYTPEFRAQAKVQPLIGFPDIERHYQSEELWPFFMLRIPSPEQPQVQEAVRDEGLDATSDVQLLKRFGERTIANPFVLVEAGAA